MTDIETSTDSKPSRLTRLIILTTVGICIVLAGTLYVAAHQLGWTLGWLYVGLFATHVIVTLVCLSLWNPVLIGRRSHFDAAGTKSWDILWSMVFMAIVVILCVVAIRDLRAREGDPVLPGIVWLIGAAIFIFGWMLFTWSMVVNPFFEKMVRIQTDQGHCVVDSGPYAYIRHPGYVGFSAVFVSTPLLLASPGARLPALIGVLALVLRTVLEDRTLQAELPGYVAYAARVRFRLIPGVW